MECILITYKMSTIKHFSIIFITITHTVFEMTDPNKNYFNSIHFIHNGIFKSNSNAATVNSEFLLQLKNEDQS